MLFSMRKCALTDNITHTLLYIKTTIKAIKFALLFCDFFNNFSILEIFMESFGLFSLLESLLNGKTQENPSVSNPAPTPAPMRSPAAEQTEPHPEGKEQTACTPPSPDAFLNFMQDHESRIKRIKEQKK
jgi:hypothetical protein